MKPSLDVNDRIQKSLEQYSDMVIRIAYQNLKCMADAEDVAQEVFLKLLTTGPEFESGEHEKAWIIRVTVNQCRDYLRSSWFRKRSELKEEIPHTDGSQEVLDAVMRLPVRFRNVIYLHYYEDMSISEIANALGQKENTVSSWLFRARGQLRKSLAGGFDNE